MLRALIILSYALMLAPVVDWIITGDHLPGILAFVWICVGLGVFPKAINDWNHRTPFGLKR